MLLDSASLYFRGFYGVPDTVRAPDGTPVNAVRGFLDIIAKLVTDFGPDELVACWDDDWRPRWRVDLIPSYKAHRVAREVPDGVDVEETPEALVTQVPIIREVLDALGIPVVGAAQHEADDVIGTLATGQAHPVDVVTGDRDLFQLVDDAADVRVIYTARGMSNLETLTESVVVGKYGIRPQQYADFAVMRGDSSDGLPGVAGIGEKTAMTLLTEYGDLDGILAAAADPASSMKAPMRARFEAAADYLKVAPRVVEVVRDLDLPTVDARIHAPDDDRRATLEQLSEKWGLGGSLDRVRQALTTGR
ncbi:5'-3' exonuclease [Leifsonia sp. PS1209]|uniref:5'-3' exonuclease n=1 Tax=Leifsonia sp. PS1209 TaxID=2724914 RepID=UPI001442C229|nr:5'-3' exonuclease [Leifsonia sp. PS1209]QJA00873.1 5'-3' exonuclease [Leifsonia sp. PS1209]